MRIYLNPPEHFLRIKQSEDRSSGDTVLLFAPVRDLIARSNCYNPLRYPELLQDSEKYTRRGSLSRRRSATRRTCAVISAALPVALPTVRRSARGSSF